MAQYIDKNDLVAKIERRKNYNHERAYLDRSSSMAGREEEDKDILSIIDSLNVEEVDSTDVFIDKACWLRNNSHNYADNALGKEYLVNDFKSYMKGEYDMTDKQIINLNNKVLSLSIGLSSKMQELARAVSERLGYDVVADLCNGR